MIDIFLTTLIKRPYVFIFLLSFLFIGKYRFGIKQTILYLFWGYIVAWISEYLSIHYGFPYGKYHYVYENLKGEWLNLGVPVWDSASYTFLTFAGYSLAKHLFPIASPFQLSLRGAFFVTLLDIVVDPLAHRGNEWFLGKIYYYEYPGYYFNVPLSNFLGWFGVAFIIIWGFLGLQSFFKLTNPDSQNHPISQWGPLFLYFGIFFFNWVITIWIGAYLLALCDLVWIAIPIYLLLKKKNYRRLAF